MPPIIDLPRAGILQDGTIHLLHNDRPVILFGPDFPELGTLKASTGPTFQVQTWMGYSLL